jgi:hypothetical protein
LVERFNARQAELVAGMQQSLEQARAAAGRELRKAWGAEFQANVDAADVFMEKLGLSDQEIAGLERGIGPQRLLEIAARLGRGMSESRFAGGESPPAGQEFGMTPEAAKAKIAELQTDPRFQAQYRHENAKIRGPAVERLFKLRQLAFPDETR